MRHRVLLSATLALAAVVAPAAEVTAPAPLPDVEALAVVLIPDLRETLNHIEEAAGTVAPGTLAPGQLADQLGQMLQDPGLANLAPGAVVLAVAPDVLIPAVAVLVPTVDGELYAKAADLAGIGAVVAEGHVILFQAGNLKAEELGQRLSADYMALAAQSGTADARLLVSPQRVGKAYGMMAQGFLMQGMRQAAAKQGEAGKAQLAMQQLYIQGLLTMIGDVPVMQHDLRIAPDALSIDSLVGASGSLAKALTPSTTPSKAAERLGAGDGVMAVQGTYPAGLVTYATEQMAALQKKPGGKEVITAEMLDLMRAWPAALGTDVAMRLSSTTEQPYAMAMVGAVKDQAAAAKLFAAGQAMQQSGTGLGAVNKQMGISTTVAADVRTVGGLAVSRSTLSIADDATPEAKQAAAMAVIAGTMEYAFGPAWYFAASQPADLDRMITAKPVAAPLPAQTVIGAGRDGYGQMNFVGLMQMSMRVLILAGQPAPMAGIMDAAPGAPLSMAWTSGSGCARFEWHIPYAGFQAMGQAMGGGGGF